MQVLQVLLVLCAVSVASAYTAPFQSTQVVPGKPEIGLYTTFRVGSPPQLVKVFTYLRPLPYSPVFKLGTGCTDGVYDRTKSSTFHLGQIVPDKNNTGQQVVYGRDTMDIFGGLSEVSISVQEGGDCTYGTMSLGRSNPGYSLIRDNLKGKPNPVLITAFEHVGTSMKDGISGTMIIGDYGAEVCSGDWVFVDTVPSEFGEDWAIKIDQIDVGRYSKKATVNMSFKGLNYEFGVPSSELSNIKRSLGVDRNNKVDCNNQIPIKFKVSGGKTLIVNVDVYANLSTRDANGRCVSRIFDYGRFYQMPITWLHGKCQLLNYSTNQTGYAPMNSWTTTQSTSNGC